MNLAIKDSCMFNWSWRLRKQTELVSPKSSSFRWALWYHLFLSGTHIKLKVPRHKSHVAVECCDTFGQVEIKDLSFSTRERHGKRQRSVAVIARKWRFYGPWFTGDMGSISFSGAVISALQPTLGLNYFHPRALEAAIAEYLTVDYSHEFSLDRKRQDWIAPVNWRQQPGFPCIAARFDVVHSDIEHKGPHSYLIFPLTKTHYFVFECSMSRPPVFTDIKPEPALNDWIDPKPFLTLIDQVLNSVQIELSPQAKADQEEALRGLAEHEKELVKEFPPLKWVASEEPKKEQDDDDDDDDDEIFLGQIIKTK
jgi:hypothetical protein